MRGYADVTLVNHDYPFDLLVKEAVPVGVELLPGTTNLAWFEHPENAVYVFGPEDGGLSKSARLNCHYFVQIPGYHCLNLAAAVNVVLYDRRSSNGRKADRCRRSKCSRNSPSRSCSIAVLAREGWYAIRKDLSPKKGPFLWLKPQSHRAVVAAHDVGEDKRVGNPRQRFGCGEEVVDAPADVA